LLIAAVYLQGEEEKAKEDEDEDPLDETALDWWSKYFASLDTLNEVKTPFRFC